MNIGRTCSEKGFTLVEVLITMVIFAIVVTFAYIPMTSMTREQRKNVDIEYAVNIAKSQVDRIKGRLAMDPNFWEHKMLKVSTVPGTGASYPLYIDYNGSNTFESENDYDGRDFDMDRSLASDVYNQKYENGKWKFIRQIVIKDVNITTGGGVYKPRQVQVLVYYADPAANATTLSGSVGVNGKYHKLLSNGLFSNPLARITFMLMPYSEE